MGSDKQFGRRKVTNCLGKLPRDKEMNKSCYPRNFTRASSHELSVRGETKEVNMILINSHTNRDADTITTKLSSETKKVPTIYYNS